MVEYIIEKEEYKKKEKDSCIIKYIAREDKFYFSNEKENSEIKNLYKFFKDNIVESNLVIFYLDFSNTKLSLKKSDRLVCNIKRLQKLYTLKEKEIFVYRKTGNSCYEEFIEYSICLLNYINKKEKYNYLYDCICKYLDDRVVKTNVCGFKDDKCIVKRNTNVKDGCCHHFNNIYCGLLYEKKMHLCEHQVNKKCKAQCISCKMYMCDTLRRKGYKFTPSNVILVKRYFNPIQKVIIMTTFYRTKEQIMKKLLFWSL